MTLRTDEVYKTMDMPKVNDGLTQCIPGAKMSCYKSLDHLQGQNPSYMNGYTIEGVVVDTRIDKHGNYMVAVKPDGGGNIEVLYSQRDIIRTTIDECEREIHWRRHGDKNMVSTTNGPTLKTHQRITKDDIITLCGLLNRRDEYKDLCEFQPEPICGGGILFKFKGPERKAWYKSVRLNTNCLPMNHSRRGCGDYGDCTGRWYWVKGGEDYLADWRENEDVVFYENQERHTLLKWSEEAPAFTVDELAIWEGCLFQIGIIKIGKGPTQKSLKLPNN